MKIRVWHKKFKKFLPKSEWFVNFDGKLFYEDNMDYELLECPSNLYVVQQWTGEYDKNNKEIFEGDYIKHQYGGEVLVRKTTPGMDDNPGWILYDSMSQGGEIEVTGNIFENEKKDI